MNNRNKDYLSPELHYSVLEAENLVLCASCTTSASDFETNDLTNDDFWN